MPEGPSLVILAEQAKRFQGKKILRTRGDTRIDIRRLVGKRPRFRTWGKHFLIDVGDFALRNHFLMFGSYVIDGRKPRAARLGLTFESGEINFYSCAIRELEGKIDELYDWRTDVMSDKWSPTRALRKLEAMPGALVCDVLLDQNVFAGVGNIIKNEVLFRIRVHPLSRLGAMPPARLRELVREARRYSFQFLEWKKAYVLRKHWLAHTKRTCPRCNIPFVKAKLGETQRRSFYCENCQQRYGALRARQPFPAPRKQRAAKKGRRQRDGTTARRSDRTARFAR
jgi:endonuclease-8